MMNIIIGILFLMNIIDYLETEEAEIFRLMIIGLLGLHLLKEFYIFF